MSTARHHAEWLALTEISGPFLSLEVLLQVFPQGLDAHDPDRFRVLKQAYQEWSLEKSDRAFHRTWVQWVLETMLEFPADLLRTGQDIPSHLRLTVEQHQETLVPDWVLVDPDTAKPRLLIQQVAPTQKLEGTTKNSHWAASPATRLIELLRGTGVQLGLLTNGEQWMLINAPKIGTASLVSWYGNIWIEEKITLRAFRSLVGVQRFLGVADSETLEALFDRSKDNQQEITDQLGLQVRRSLEVLIQRLDRLDQDFQGQLLANISDQTLYEAALFVMMRLVFLLSAEEKDLLLLGQERYDKNYALSTLQQSLREMADHSGEEILERRYDAWYRLLALFRAVHQGVYHHDFRLPAYGGNLFDPDKFPFLEGRFGGKTHALAIDNRTVLHLLESLQILQVKVPGGGFEPRRLSFKGLEVEQIGHVYESLLDHRAVRATSTVLGLEGTKNKEPEVALTDLEAQAVKGEEALLNFLKQETGRSVTALKKLISLPSPQPSPIGRGSQEISELAGMKRQIPPVLLERAKELRKNQTPAEAILWECLRDRRLCDAKFRRQHNIGQFIVDFYCHTSLLVIEVDGSSHDHRQTEDQIRDQWFKENGFQVLRFRNEQIFNNLEQVLATIMFPISSQERGLGGEVNSLSLPSRLGGEVNLTPYEENRYLLGCRNDRRLWERIKPFYKLIRKDTYGYPVIIPEGSVYVTTGTARRESGTHYTPKHLTEEIVKYTLEPLVYEGVSEGKSEGEWRLKSAQELLSLKICDPTMGSGAFLVQVCRYLSDRVLEAWSSLEELHPKKVFTVFGNVSKPGLEEPLLPDTPEERLIFAKRLIAERCLYGVDKNPLAVEMAKLSLWLETLQKDRPFTFLDHALRCGDSLVGVSIQQLKYWSLDISGQSYQLGIGADEVQRLLNEAISKRLEIEQFSVISPQDQLRKESLLAEAEARLKDLKDRANLLVSSYLANVKKSEQEDIRSYLLMVADGRADITDFQRRDLPDLDQLRPFHWELEFPEVFLNSPINLASHPKNQNLSNNDTVKQSPVGWASSPNKEKIEEIGKMPILPNLHFLSGFDAIVGNPPFKRGKDITGILGTPYRNYIVDSAANGVKGSADLVTYFFLQSFRLIRKNATCGLVATNTIAQGDMREVGLDQIAKNGVIYRAVPSRPWFGTAALEVAYVWLKKGDWQGKYYLDNKEVTGITPYLTLPGLTTGKPYKLVSNYGKASQGLNILGIGFVVSYEKAEELIGKNPKNKDVLFPYLNGQDLNSNPDQAPSRWVINFFDWPLNSEQDNPKKPKGAPYASDYPDCLEIVERLVKPERPKAQSKAWQEKWWQYASTGAKLYEAIANCDRVLFHGFTSKYVNFAFVPSKNVVYGAPHVVIALGNYKDFLILQSNFHTQWVLHHSSSMKTDVRYTPSDAFETFPFPNLNPTTQQQLEDIGQRYYEHRQAIMQRNQEGLTKTYNRFHDPDETDPEIEKLRQLHIEMDNAVCAAYGWTDLLFPISSQERGLGGEVNPISSQKNELDNEVNQADYVPSPQPSPIGRGSYGLNHDFHQTKQGLRFTISEENRREILDRLLQLNHQRYAEEVKQGLHDKTKKKASKTKKAIPPNPDQLGLNV